MKNGKTHLLVVEDEALVRLSERRFLENAGYLVSTAVDGAEAAETIREDSSVDAVVTDVNLGPAEPDGIAAAQEILTIRDVPIVFLTNQIDEETIRRAHGVRHYGYVLKPTGEHLVPATIDQAIKLHREALERERRAIESSKLFDSAPVGIFRSRSSGGFIRANPELARILGASSPEEVIERYRKLERDLYVDPGARTRLYRLLEREGTANHFEFEAKRVDGKHIWLAVSARVSLHRSDGTTEVDGFLTDVSGRRHAEGLLRESENRYRMLFEHVPVGLYRSTSDRKIVDANRRMVKMLGYDSKEDLLQISPYDVYAHREDAEEAGRRMEAGGLEDFESEWRCRDGTTIWVRENASVRSIPGVQHQIYEGAVADITRRKRSEERAAALLRENRLLLREVHHRVKNDLSLVRAVLSIQAADAEDASGRAALETAAQRVEAIAELYTELYHSEQIAHVHLPAFISRIMARHAGTQGGGVTNAVDIEEIALPRTAAVPVGLIVNELVTNAYKHAFAGAKDRLLEVSIRRLDDEGRVRIRVADNGKGIAEAPDATDWTSGFGFTLVRSLAEQRDGTVDVSYDGGTVVTVVLSA